MAGVAIILSPVLVSAWKRAGAMSAMTSSVGSNFLGRMIGISLSFPNIRTRHGKAQRISGRINMFLASIYQPVDLEEQVLFNLELSSFYDKMPKNAEIISGQDVNANVGPVLTIGITREGNF